MKYELREDASAIINSYGSELAGDVLNCVNCGRSMSEHSGQYDCPTAAQPITAEQLVEYMAESAHNSWWGTYISLGYTSRKAAWGEEFMVPFEELSEQGKEFDRMIMRAILKTFQDKGISLVFPHEGAA